jgi:putative transposase
MNTQDNLRHTKYECKYHVVFIPKYRQKTLFKELRRYLGEVFHDLARQKESWREEGHLLEDHVHMLVSIPPKHAVSSVIGFMKGKATKLYRSTLLGSRILRVDCRQGRGNDTGIYTSATRRG